VNDVTDGYQARAIETERLYIEQLGIGRRRAVEYIDSRELRDLPWGVRGRSEVRRKMCLLYGANYFEKQPGRKSPFLPDGYADDPNAAT
jgi:hypothetical protein